MRISPTLGLFLLLPALALADDWPTFRGDIHRSAVSSEELVMPLNFAWSHTPDAPPARAWTPPKGRNISAGADGLTSTLDYDKAFHAIAADGRVYYASSATDSIYCLDQNGFEHWVYTTEGPIRLAPFYFEGHIYTGSDDGYIYCLDAQTGKETWKKLAGPEDRRVPGNGRLISEWPVRSGLVVDKGQVYFCAGLFPSHGVYMGALDAKTGKESWKNKITVSPQGYLLATDERIFVPTGRTPFQEFARDDGKSIAKLGRSTSWGKRLHGGCFAVVIDGQLASGPSEDGQIDLFKKAKSVVRLPGLQLLVHDDIAYILTTDDLRAVDRKQLASAVDQRRGKGGGDAELWASTIAQPRCMAKTAKALLVGGAGWVAAYSVDAGKEIWRSEIGGTVESLAISDGRVYASTDDGRIHCFSEKVKEPVKIAASSQALAAYRDDARATAALAATPIRKGYVLVLGLASGKTIAELAAQSEFRVVGRDADPAKVQAVRAYLMAEGLYGSRAVIHQGSMDRLPYTDYIGNIVTTELPTPPTPAEELERMVRPHGGVFFARLANAATAEDLVKQFPSAKRTPRGDETDFIWRRPGLKGEGEWSHFYATPANTACSGDTFGKSAMRLQWFGRPGPEKMVDRHSKTSSPLYKNGRMFVPGLNFFVAVDAYNGTILWEKDVPDSVRIGAMRDSSNMALGDDALFIATRDSCLKVDPQTGTIRSRLSADAYFKEKGNTWGYVATVDNLVYGSVSRPKAIVRNEVRGRDAIWRRDEPLVVCSDRVFAVNTQTDGLIWDYHPKSGMIINPSIAIANGRMHFIQSENPETVKVTNGQVGLPALLKTASIVALDAQSGKLLWKHPVELQSITDAIYLSSGPDTIIVTGTHYRPVSADERRGLAKPGQALRCRYEVFAYDCKTGNPLWQRILAPNRDHELKGGHGINIQHPAIVNEIVYGPGFAFHIRDGQDYAGWNWEVSRKCGTISTSANFAFSRSSQQKICYIFDLKDGKNKPLSAASRPGCWINILPAGGLVLVPEASAGCTCEYSIQSSMAFLPDWAAEK